jgi:glycosyltransferase involved in cell wall biosynthesis
VDILLNISILHFEDTRTSVSGYGRYLANLCRSLVEKGHQVDTLSLFGSPSNSSLWAERLKRTRYSAFLFSNTKQLNLYDIVLFTEPLYPQNLILLRYLKMQLKVKVVLWLSIPRIKAMIYYLPINHKFPAYVTSEKAFVLAKQIATRVELFPSGVDIGRLQPVDMDKKWDFLYIGNLYREKGVLLLLQAMKLLKEKKVSLKLKIIHASGEGAVYYRRYISNNKLDNVDMEMSIIDKHLSIFNSARVYVYPGISYHRVADVVLTIIEAYACGLPVVTTSLYRYINLPNMIYTDANPELLANAMLKAIETWNQQKQGQILFAIQRDYSL